MLLVLKSNKAFLTYVHRYIPVSLVPKPSHLDTHKKICLSSYSIKLYKSAMNGNASSGTATDVFHWFCPFTWSSSSDIIMMLERSCFSCCARPLHDSVPVKALSSSSISILSPNHAVPPSTASKKKRKVLLASIRSLPYIPVLQCRVNYLSMPYLHFSNTGLLSPKGLWNSSLIWLKQTESSWKTRPVKGHNVKYRILTFNMLAMWLNSTLLNLTSHCRAPSLLDMQNHKLGVRW